MARLAAEGCMFTHCVSNYPVCSPYRSILLTGRWPYETGVIDNGIDLSPKQATLGKCFRDAGYRTGYIGKWHLGGNHAEAFGFDHSLIWTGTNKHLESTYHPKSGPPVDTNRYNATLMTDQAIDFINVNKDAPFMLMLSWNPPHSDFLDAPPAKQELYPEGSLQWRPNVPEESKLPGTKEGPGWNQSAWPYVRGYHAHISAIDDELGRLLARLDELGIAGDTIVVYTSDHGSMMGSHGLGGKRLPYEESIRVPLIVRWPGKVGAGLTRNGLVGSMDLMPTLCGLAGLPVPGQCRGKDMSGVITAGAPEPDAPQLIMHISKANASGGADHPAPIFRGVRTNKYTYAVLESGPWLLFDDVEDPFQMNNRLNDPALAPLRKDLHETLQGMLKQAGDTFLL
jgi:arylsulfatase A-like enzyme